MANSKVASDVTTEETNTETPINNKSKYENLRDSELRLIRCRIVNNNPSNSQLPGRIYSVGNAKLGMITKYIPFHEPFCESYHIPYILFKALQRRKFTSITTTKNSKGEEINIVKEVPEFTLVELPPLTKEELADLAKQQALSGSLKD